MFRSAEPLAAGDGRSAERSPSAPGGGFSADTPGPLTVAAMVEASSRLPGIASRNVDFAAEPSISISSATKESRDEGDDRPGGSRSRLAAGADDGAHGRDRPPPARAGGERNRAVVHLYLGGDQRVILGGASSARRCSTSSSIPARCSGCSASGRGAGRSHEIARRDRTCGGASGRLPTPLNRSGWPLRRVIHPEFLCRSGRLLAAEAMSAKPVSQNCALKGIAMSCWKSASSLAPLR